MRASRNRRWRRALRDVSRWLPPTARISAYIVATAVAIFVVFRVAAPFLISTGLVRSGIEDVLSKWTGYQANIEGAPVLEFWPTPRITLNQVTIRRPSPNGDTVFGQVDSLSADFSLVAALRGQAVFHEFHFIRPNLHLIRDDKGLIDWTNQGQLAKAIGNARAAGPGEALDTKLDAEIGSLTVEDGMLDLTDQASGNVYKLDGITADITWPRLSQALSAVVIARLNQQDLKLDFASAQPLLLFAGKNADVKATLTSKLINSSFTGNTNISNVSSMSGQLDLNAPDVPALLAWSGKHLPAARDLKNVSLNADVITADYGLRFNDLNFTLNDASATGYMDLSYSASGKPKVGGTLAFDRMNLSPIWSAFSLRLAADENTPGGSQSDLLRRLELDLRFSAKQADFAPFHLNDVAASVLVSAGQAKFDIGDSQFEGGDLNARLQVTDRDFDGGGKLQVSIQNADFARLIDQLKLEGPLPLTSAGSLELSLSTSKPIWAAGAGDVTGSVRFSAGPGSLRNFDIIALRKLATQKDFFPLSEAAGRAFDFDSIAVDASVANGSAEVRSARIQGRDETMVLSGVIPYRTSGLALSGALEATDDSRADELPLLPFFVGGSWPDPVISSLSGILQKPVAQ